MMNFNWATVSTALKNKMLENKDISGFKTLKMLYLSSP